MANSKGSSNVRNLMYPGKHALLPPKCPFPSIAPTYTDYVQNSVIGSKPVQKPREGNTYHQRTSSESVLIEEQPSWLDDLLNEPETPVRRGGHRRSSSDSFAYIDTVGGANSGYSDQDDYIYRNMIASSRACQEFDHHKDARQFPSYAKLNSTKKKNMSWEAPLNARNQSGGIPTVRGNNTPPSSVSSGPPQESDGSPTVHGKQDALDSSVQDTRTAPERKDGSNAKSNSETETKRAKQQFAQRSRVRKLQYIAELERNVQALQAEGSEVSAELEFLNQQNLILGMENKALKQRLESLAQEQLIKYLEHEVLEKEIGRLRAMYLLLQQQQQQKPLHHKQKQQQPSSSHRRASSRDLDSQFANLSL